MKKCSNDNIDVERTETSKKENPVTWTLIWTVTATAVGSGFQHGYNTGVLNAPQKVIESWMNSSMQVSDEDLTVIWGATTSVMCIGGVIGGALTGVLSIRFGRRAALIMNNLLAMAAGILSGGSKYASNPWMLICGRFVIGINMGLNAGVGTMYLSEISPTRLRGSVGATYLVCMTSSILISNLVGAENVFGTTTLWPAIFFIILIPALYQTVALLLAPESPKYLLEIGEDEGALSASIKLCGEAEGTRNIKTMKAELEETQSRPNITVKHMLETPNYRRPLIIMCFLMAAQQFAGINVVIYYSTHIFKMAKLSEMQSQVATVGVGAVNVLSTLASLFLVEILGRKPLLMMGFGGMALISGFLMVCLYYVETHTALAYAAVILVYLFVTMFAVGPGPVPWIIGPELFTTAIRPLALSIASPANWLANFVVGIVFLPLQKIMGPTVFVIFIISTTLSTIYFYVKVPETKNKPIEEIAATFNDPLTNMQQKVIKASRSTRAEKNP